MRRAGTWLVTALAAVSLAACGSSPKPYTARELASAEASLRAAQEAGAQQDPRAALHLKLAREGIAQAETSKHHGDVLLERAKVDADLALAIAREARMRSVATAARADVEQLRRSAPQQRRTP